MGERPPVFDLEVSPRRVITIQGQTYRDFDGTFPEEWVDKIRHGYMCINCYEPLQAVGAFPENCPMCGYQIRKYQPEDFIREFRGEEYIGTGGVDAQYERSLEALKEEREMKDRARKIGIVVP